MASEVIATDKQYPKLSKAVSGYLEIDHFKNADLHAGYFCYNCIYFIKEHHCAIVEDTGPDVNANESGIVAPPWPVHAMGSKRKGGAVKR
jgi:hypothetical protein